MKKILFVCTGNTCRSPMAAALFNHMAALEPSGFEFTAVSAGLAVPYSAPASENTILAMNEYPGSDLSEHRSRNVSHSDIKEAFLVLAMEPWHQHELLSRFPDMHQKIFTLKEYSYGVTGGIRDPYGGSLEEYTRCAQEIAQAVERLIEKLKKS